MSDTDARVNTTSQHYVLSLSTGWATDAVFVLPRALRLIAALNTQSEREGDEDPEHYQSRHNRFAGAIPEFRTRLFGEAALVSDHGSVESCRDRPHRQLAHAAAACATSRTETRYRSVALSELATIEAKVALHCSV